MSAAGAVDVDVLCFLYTLRCLLHMNRRPLPDLNGRGLSRVNTRGVSVMHCGTLADDKPAIALEDVPAARTMAMPCQHNELATVPVVMMTVVRTHVNGSGVHVNAGSAGGNANPVLTVEVVPAARAVAMPTQHHEPATVPVVMVTAVRADVDGTGVDVNPSHRPIIVIRKREAPAVAADNERKQANRRQWNPFAYACEHGTTSDNRQGDHPASPWVRHAARTDVSCFPGHFGETRPAEPQRPPRAGRTVATR